MFEVTVVRTKAGTIGQVSAVGKILWETEPFPTEMVATHEDKLRRSNEFDVSYDKATQAARDKLAEVLEGLFA